MGALFSRIKTWVSTEDVVYSDLNAEFDNILNNLTIANVDDYSANVSQMQTTADPGEVGSESLATTGAGELTRLRFLIREITGEDEWYESPTSSLLGLANAIGTGLTDNRLVSGRVRSSGTNDMPVFLVPNGAARTVSLKGSTTNFIYYVSGTEYTISTDVSLTGLTAAPSSNNTCLINDAVAADDAYTKHTGEDGSIIPVDNMGSEISALVGKYAAFKLAGTTDEYFIAYVESSTVLSKAFRGFFFDSSDAPIPRAGYTNNDTITLMKLTWVFAKSDGTLTATYNNPVWAKDEPTSPAQGDYWFDLSTNRWKVYGVGSYAVANAHLVGVCIQDATNTIGARSFEFFKNYDNQNTLELFYDSVTQVKARSQGAIVNVWGSSIKCDRNIRVWDITLDRDSGVSESASTYYYAYLTQVGDVVISDVKPYDRREDLGGHYHPYASWRCLGRFFNDGSSNIDANSVNSYFSRYESKDLKEASAALHIETPDKVIRFSGASATEYLPPAARMKGQELILLHGGTSISQVYTLTADGAETFSSNGSTTFLMHTNGQALKIYSDGVGWIVLDHYAMTKWTAEVVSTLAMTTGVKGTTSIDAVSWRRNGEYADVYFIYDQTGAGTGASDGIRLTLPNSLAINTTITRTNTNASGSLDEWGTGTVEGSVMTNLNSSSAGFGFVSVYDANNVRFIMQVAGTTQGPWGTGVNNISNTNVEVTAKFRVPISGWEP